MLQNVHLSLNFCAEIIDILIETEHVSDSFRLWVTTEVHLEFPIVRKSFVKGSHMISHVAFWFRDCCNWQLSSPTSRRRASGRA